MKRFPHWGGKVAPGEGGQWSEIGGSVSVKYSTNNLGERDLRPWKTKLKVSGCFRTLTGAGRYARIKGFCATAKKHGKTVFDELVAIQQGTSFLRLT